MARFNRGQLSDAIAIVIVLLYSISIIAGIIDHTYQMPISLHAVMGAVATAFFTDRMLKNRVKNDPPHSDHHDSNKGHSYDEHQDI